MSSISVVVRNHSYHSLTLEITLHWIGWNALLLAQVFLTAWFTRNDVNIAGVMHSSGHVVCSQEPETVFCHAPDNAVTKDAEFKLKKKHC